MNVFVIIVMYEGEYTANGVGITESGQGACEETILGAKKQRLNEEI
jgi:hypothetical protein